MKITPNYYLDEQVCGKQETVGEVAAINADGRAVSHEFLMFDKARKSGIWRWIRSNTSGHTIHFWRQKRDYSTYMLHIYITDFRRCERGRAATKDAVTRNHNFSVMKYSSFENADILPSFK
ncbi:hypothetical protein J6590_101239 [Homalodisca vitripennis]|nr:hypothetical protein J6590_101239 [Homalodisca vitripennis]